MFPVFISIALLALAAALALPALVEAAPAARAHLAFAVGIMPLILAAFDYFVPVLTRSGIASAPARALPWLALGAGLLALAQFVTPGTIPYAYSISALGALMAASASAAWMVSRGRRAVGRPHPCLHWYVAAALCLAAAAAAALAMPLWPDQHAALRRFHLHLNTLGFIGLTAIGTLQVLMPTVAGPDPGVADRLRRDLAPAAVGSVLVAAGAAWQAWLAWIGLALLLIPIARLGAAWWRLYRSAMFSRHGAAPPLAASLAGFTILLAAGALQAGGFPTAGNAAFAFVLLFLLPLVTGAAAALLPVLLRPGVQTAWHAGFRARAGRHGGLRAALFLLGGIAFALGREEGVVLSLVALVLFAAQLSRALAARADYT
jgi:hypothetical protein